MIATVTPEASAAPSAAAPSAAAPQVTPIPPAPGWLEELERRRAARANHFFVLHGNVADYVYDGQTRPYRLPSYVSRYLAATGCQRLGSLSLSQGLVWIDPTRLTP